MKLLTTVKWGALLLVGLNLLMALGSIWIFVRMAPAIEVIIDQNERSLEACEKMLTALGMSRGNKSDNLELKVAFERALKAAQDNITEDEEPEALALIDQSYPAAFKNDFTARLQTIAAINLLGKINREAMVRADKRARQLGNGGAWGVVFMASAVFMAGLFFMRTLKRNLVKPLEEIYSVISAHRQGENMRRCSGADMSKDIKTIFDGMNELFDKIYSKSL
jgi:hypothetical protein